MQQINSITALRNAIKLLKVVQAHKEQQIKKQFYLTCESLRPINLVKSRLKNAVSSPYLIDNIVGIGIGLATGFLTKKIVARVSGRILRMLIGSIIQVSIAKLVTHKTDAIGSTRKPLFINIFIKKELNSEQT